MQFTQFKLSPLQAASVAAIARAHGAVFGQANFFWDTSQTSPKSKRKSIPIPTPIPFLAGAAPSHASKKNAPKTTDPLYPSPGSGAQNLRSYSRQPFLPADYPPIPILQIHHCTKGYENLLASAAIFLKARVSSLIQVSFLTQVSHEKFKITFQSHRRVCAFFVLSRLRGRDHLERRWWGTKCRTLGS